MKEKYNRFFERVVSRTSDEELYRAVLNSRKAENMKNEKNTNKRFGKTMVIPVVAAAVVAATSVGAVAVYTYNVNQEYAEALERATEGFPQNYYDENGDPADQQKKVIEDQTFEMLNVEINQTFECGGRTFEFPGAVSDGENIYIMYNILFDKSDKLLSDGKEYSIHFDDVPDGVREIPVGTGAGRISERDENTVAYSTFTPLGGIDKCGDTLTLKGGWLNIFGSFSIGEDESMFKSQDLDFELDIPLDADMSKFNKSVEIPSAPSVSLGEWGDWDYVGVSATPLGVTFNMRTDGETPYEAAIKLLGPEIPAIVNFKDGSALDITGDVDIASLDRDNKTFSIKSFFNYPINTDDILSIQFENRVVDMDGNVTTVETEPIVPNYTGGNFVYNPEDGTISDIEGYQH